MNRPINDLDFWKQRIEDAKKGYTHYSVYVANPQLWKYIENHHRKIIRQYIKMSESVLDAGCGYGRAVEFLPTRYTGVDFSPDFIAQAKENYPDKTFIQSRLEDLPFNDKDFDWAVCISIKYMIIGNLGVEAWEPMEKELKRVAKKVLILEYEDPTQYEVL